MPLRAGRSSGGAAIPKMSGAMVAASTVEPAASTPSTIVAAPSSSQPNERSEAWISMGRPAKPRRRTAPSTSRAPTESTGGMDTELVAVGIGHGHPFGAAPVGLAAVDAGRTKVDQAV